MLIFSAGHKQVYRWRSSMKKNCKALRTNKRPTWAKWEESKAPLKTQEATPGNPRRKMHNTHYEPDATNLDHQARRPAFNHLETALHPTTSRPWKTQNRSNEEMTEKRSPWRSRDENTDYYWGIPGHTTVSFSSLQKKNTQIIFSFFNMSNEFCNGLWICIEVSRS